MLVEHARNVVGIIDASHSEYGGIGTSVVEALSCSLAASEIVIEVEAETKLAEIHGTGTRPELTHCNYGLNPKYQHIASEGGLVVSALDDTGEVRAIERLDHPFFLGTLYQPQRQPADALPHALYNAFVLAVA